MKNTSNCYIKKYTKNMSFLLRGQTDVTFCIFGVRQSFSVKNKAEDEIYRLRTTFDVFRGCRLPQSQIP